MKTSSPTTGVSPYGGAMAGSFTRELRDSITDIYGAILAHPFM
jgi:hypothetical protein